MPEIEIVNVGCVILCPTNSRNLGKLFFRLRWDEAWHLHPADNRSTTMNIYSAWTAGVTGRGVKVVHIDDGIDHTHRDLRYNYYSKRESTKSHPRLRKYGQLCGLS